LAEVTVGVTVIVVTWRAREHLAACLAALAAQTRRHRLVVIDNASTDGTEELLEERLSGHHSATIVRLPRNAGFAGGVARGLKLVETPYVALLNDDAEPAPDWLAQLLHGLGSHVAVTSRLVLPSGLVNNTGVVLRPDGYGADRGLGEPDGPPYDRPAEVFGFSGGACLLRTDAVRAAGGFPAPFFLYYEDTDTSWRLRLAGGRIGYVPGAVVRHGHSVSADQTSVLFSFSNERNRLLTLTRCAPAGVAAAAPVRFLLTTGSLAVKRVLRRPIPPAPHFRVAVRLRVFASYLKLLPWALVTRRRVGRMSTVDRGAVWSAWADAR
jgi:GT2 family glycosyltransferase